ncbi:glutamate decarboxylase [Ethanoligenens harbinense]|uniref:Glutamate decarboxylase n=1 Tax=Ethanoligenens harbinense (strain DSM 18485 / JCM 12961 / CGMCC 1.5033 / YUAN-3) TaxID=663278 RepID=E6U2L0_ETHHY|nr:glutamate decarboxylase [Ethanoligenens harbinense]ADU26301.1 glutamate decarboxylase [Ethanoligenens harbinense YUAN-3]AVQ95435.1 glutamate decarboxylase [Ethanoligenens harbinense YUAN-3]AYF38100.1 glutamate decarboxylase [Ethanoligenens harbinense]AYF40845.1 glutamate decarboxylase [Ethanoligenens harbinense]QCN91675.1 glutamate decarboxylase [Ethanoligenens harbinense]
MLHQNKNNEKLQKIHPANTLSLYDDVDIPKYTLRKQPIEPDVACRLIKNELLDEGNARLNLATFCSTFMEDEAIRLMADTLEKNAIDKSEYPSTIELENRCVNIIADLWHAPENQFIGTSTVGSSEACMLAGLAMKFRWRNRAQRLGLDICEKKPNLVISSGYQVCWEKFCVYWDVELRAVPMDPEHLSLDVNAAIRAVDAYTIGIVGILGQTYTGKFDDIRLLDKAVGQYNSQTEETVYIHVDAASGGLFAPFSQPELEWDFRLENVVSINTSGHKYGLVYPGIGWVVWRDKTCLPKELIFEVNYLGGTMPTMAINFSRSASHIIGQYYNFLRLGYDGYCRVHRHTRKIADYLAENLDATGLFALINRGDSIPVVCFTMKEQAADWTLYDLSDQLERNGWQVPVYPLPNHAQNIIVCRLVCRSDMSLNLAQRLMEDIHLAIETLGRAHPRADRAKRGDIKGFTH